MRRIVAVFVAVFLAFLLAAIVLVLRAESAPPAPASPPSAAGYRPGDAWTLDLAFDARAPQTTGRLDQRVPRSAELVWSGDRWTDRLGLVLTGDELSWVLPAGLGFDDPLWAPSPTALGLVAGHHYTLNARIQTAASGGVLDITWVVNDLNDATFQANGLLNLFGRPFEALAAAPQVRSDPASIVQLGGWSAALVSSSGDAR